MPKEKLKTIYVCTQCGETSPRWLGRCPSCGAWNTMTEDVVAEPAKASSGKAAAAPRVTGQTSLVPQKLKSISTTEEKSRIVTGISELDRVLGGGIVIGSVTLIGGEPGIGKSTILLQLCGEVSKTKNVLYVTGEESVRQIKLRAVRLNVPEDNISLVAESDVDEICGLIESMKPDLVVIDSIQTMRCTDISSSSGTVSQVKESSARFLNVAKTLEIPTFIVGHVNKDGAIAGPKVMEHIVDTVLYFEGDKTLPYRVLLAAGKMHASGVAGEGGEKIMTPADAEAFMAAGADIILLPAPGTVPGITQEYAHRLIEVVHSRGKLALTAIGTSQEGADVATIRQIALMCKMAGADIHHIGDTGVPGMALPQNIMAYSIAIRGERHTYHKMAQSVNR